MRRTRDRSIMAAAGLIAAALAPLPGARAQEPQVTGALTVRVVQLQREPTRIDVGDPGVQPGDYLVFAARLVDPATGARVGRARGLCFNISGSAATGNAVHQCSFTFDLTGGTIVTQGIGIDQQAPATEVAITGGTGRFRNARGELLIEQHTDPEGFLLTFHVLP